MRLSLPVLRLDAMDADDECDLEQWLALYRDCCAQSGIEPLPDDEARDLARRYHDLLAPGFEVMFQMH